MKKKMGLLVVIGFVFIQIYASLSRSSLYPFSAYRMFSKHWNNKVVMDYVSIADSNNREYSFSMLLPKIPFFQANHLSFITFLDPSSADQKSALCRELLTNVDPLISSLRIFAEERVYERLPSGAAQMSIQKKEQVYECQRI